MTTATLSPYLQKVFDAYQAASRRTGGAGASAVEVMTEMIEEGTLAAIDTVIDVADRLKELSEAGYLGRRS